ncbi:phage tail tip fiber protein [Atlantibacter hermannii]|uniref:phage tail tip fiber protein n=1 Tax=Atlantibacter hermannii TaxID=565 RepID=UPI00398AAFDD
MVVTWDPVKNAVAYEAQWRQNNGEWINAPRTGNTRFEVDGIYAGRYVVRVRAINVLDVASVWVTSAETELTGKIGKPPMPINFSAKSLLWGIELSWNFPPGAMDTEKTEIHYSADQNTVLLLTDVPYPASSYQQMGLRAGQIFWYRARLVDRIGNKSDWTDWIRGMASDEADEYLAAIGADLLTSEDGKRLTEQIDFTLAGQMQVTLAQVEGAQIQYEQLGLARAEISQVKITQVDAQKAFAQFQELVSVQLGESAAEILRISTAQATADEAFAEYKQVVSATIGEVNSNIVTLQHAQASTIEALAEYQTQTTATFQEQQAAINEKFTAYANATTANAIYTLKTGVKYNGNYYDAGLSVAVIADGSGVKTRVAINADQFVMLSGQGSVMYSPFAIVNGQVFLSSGFIQDGTITNAKIGQYIQSNTWDGTGNVGWHINKSGFAWFAGVTVRGTVYAESGSFRGTVYATDGEFRGTVYASGGKFTGTVEANSFIGDVANGMVFDDAPQNYVRSFQYVDSATFNLSKQVVVMMNVTVTGQNGTSAGATAVININGSSRTFYLQSPGGGSTTSCCIHSIRTTERVINVSCSTGVPGGAGGSSLSSPTMLILRGSGSFAQTA